MIVFTGEPRSTQHIYGHYCMGKRAVKFMTAEGKALKEQYQWEAKSQWKEKPLIGDVQLSITFFFKNKRRRDLDNQNKLVLDALSGIMFEDDSQISTLTLHREYDAERPRIEITTF